MVIRNPGQFSTKTYNCWELLRKTIFPRNESLPIMTKQLCKSVLDPSWQFYFKGHHPMINDSLGKATKVSGPVFIIACEKPQKPLVPGFSDRTGLYVNFGELFDGKAWDCRLLQKKIMHCARSEFHWILNRPISRRYAITFRFVHWAMGVYR